MIIEIPMLYKHRLFLFFTLVLTLGFNPMLYSQGESDIIDVIGKKYGLLKLHFKINKQKPGNIARARALKTAFTKYLKWSGIFKLQRDKFSADLSLTIDFFHQIHASIESNEGVQLYYTSTKEITDINQEREILKMIGDIIYQLTGQKSIFRSAIAFIQKDPVMGHQLILIDSFGNNRHVLVSDGEINVLPRWKQDATGIMYTSLRRFGGRLMYFDFLANKSTQLMKHNDNLSGGTWDRTAKKLVVSIANQGNTDLFLVNPEMGNQRLTFRSSIESNPSLSPDGSRLLFVSNRSGSIQIYQMNLNTGETFRMTFEGSYNVEPRWSHDGNFIVYAGIVKRRFQ
ncbi:MAG: hypothetical protein GY786_03140, partial [Proteobacteria bacterium]|nr:hypothetical protein [Pseudomonadota bacterium]